MPALIWATDQNTRGGGSECRFCGLGLLTAMWLTSRFCDPKVSHGLAAGSPQAAAGTSASSMVPGLQVENGSGAYGRFHMAVVYKLLPLRYGGRATSPLLGAGVMLNPELQV